MDNSFRLTLCQDAAASLSFDIAMLVQYCVASERGWPISIRSCLFCCCYILCIITDAFL